MKYIKKFSIPAILFAILVFCSPDSGTSPDQRDYIIPEDSIGYYDDLVPMFEGKCAWKCHDGESGASNIDFSSKENFMNHKILGSEQKLLDELLVPTYQLDPTSAPIYIIITQRFEPYDQMPPLPRYPLTQNQVDGIKKWIEEGAKNYPND